LQILFYRPGRRVKKLASPFLICICANDSVAPAAASMKYAAQSKHTTSKVYPYNHFDIYWGEPFEQVVRDQIEFLSKHVPIGKSVD